MSLKKLLSGALLFIIITDSGLLGPHGGLIYSLFASVALPALSPYLLIQIALTQDSPGLAGYDWYLSFVLVAAVMTVNCLWKKGARALFPNRDAFLVISAAILVVLYGLAASYIHLFLGGVQQSGARPPHLVGALMLIMILSGSVARSCLRSMPEASGLMSRFVLLVLAHSLLVSFMQIVLGPSFLASKETAEQLSNYAQLVSPTLFGFPRITGLYLTPNGFALSSLLVYLVCVVYDRDFKIESIPSLAAILLLASIVFFSFSKALMLYLAILGLIFFFVTQPKYRLAIALLAAAAMIWAFALFDIEKIDASFRISEGLSGSSYRHRAWNLTLKEFDLLKWIFGTGLSYWPVFFESHLGFSLSDPHSYLLSIPGTFGVAGSVFYLILLTVLLRRLFNKKSPSKEKFALCALLSLILVKDAVSIPYLLGNTPLTYLIWLIVLGALDMPYCSGSACRAGQHFNVHVSGSNSRVADSGSARCHAP